jgi:hypothetical protein
MGKVLIIEGLNMAGTQAAADVLFDDALIRPILKACSRPDGSLNSFELLIACLTLAKNLEGK